MVMMLEPDDDDGGVGRIRTRENAFSPYMKMRERTLIPFFFGYANIQVANVCKSGKRIVKVDQG